MPRPDLRFSESQKGGKILHHKHHGYYKCKVYGDGSILWKCRSYFKEHCPAYIVTLNNVIKRNQGAFHNHGCYQASKTSDLVDDEGDDSANDDNDDKVEKLKSLLKRALQELKAIQEEEDDDDEEDEEQEEEENENSTGEVDEETK